MTCTVSDEQVREVVAPRAVQIFLELDLLEHTPDDVLLAHLAAGQDDYRIYRLSDDLGADAIADIRSTRRFDFERLSWAVASTEQRARSDTGHLGAQRSWTIHGHCPLPLFSQIGFHLSAWAKPITLINRRKESQWDVIRLESEATPHGIFFDVTSGLEHTSDASGPVAVFISTMGNRAPREELRSFVGDDGGSLAGIVELTTSAPAVLTAENAPLATMEVAAAFSRIAALYPYSLTRGLYAFVAGPATLACIAGRAVNPNIMRQAHFAHFESGRYVRGITVPLAGRPRRTADFSADAIASRSRVLLVARSAVDQLRDTLTLGHLTTGMQFAPENAATQQLLKELEHSAEPTVEAFELKLETRQLGFGIDLLDALRDVSEAGIQDVTRHLLVHELYHSSQALWHANYRQIGRAGSVLEEIDYWADVYAIQVLAHWRADTTGIELHEAITSEIGNVISGISIFDRAEHGTRIDVLFERRLRRYLIWCLQLARSQTLRVAKNVPPFFSARLIAELAPLVGHLDPRHDKIVHRATRDTELFIYCDGKLVRVPGDANVSPHAFVELVRAFDTTGVVAAMTRIVGAHTDDLAPWALPT